MADQDDGHLDTMTQLLNHMTSTPPDADIRRDICRRAIYPPNLVVIGFIFSELRKQADYPPYPSESRCHRLYIFRVTEAGGLLPPPPPPLPHPSTSVVEELKKPGLNRVNKICQERTARFNPHQWIKSFFRAANYRFGQRQLKEECVHSRQLLCPIDSLRPASHNLDCEQSLVIYFLAGRGRGGG